VTSKERVIRALGRQPGPVPWLEIRIDNETGTSALGRDVDCLQRADDWAAVAEAIGLDCVNVRVMNRFGAIERFTRVVPLLTDWAAVERTGHPLPDESAVRQKIHSVSAKSRRDSAVIGVTLGCVDPSVLSMGFDHFCFQLNDDRKLVEAVLDLYADHCRAVIEIYSSAPEIDAIWISDDMAFDTSPYVSPRLFRELIVPRYRRMLAASSKPVILHSDGNLRPILADLLDLGIAALHPIQPGVMDIFEMKRQIGDRVCLLGNLDVDLLASASADLVRSEVFRLARGLSSGGGYVLSSSNSLVKWAKRENVMAMGEALRQFNVKVFGSAAAER
jgi:uroporphyrinogen decarboxylase